MCNEVTDDMNVDTTRNLSRVLEQTDNCADGDAFVREHAEKLPPLHIYIKALMDSASMDKSTIVQKSGISKNYIYNILSGSKTNPGRDKVIAICVAMGASFKETQRALEISGNAPLYPREERDIRISVFINKKIGDVTELNIQLDDYGLPPLDI